MREWACHSERAERVEGSALRSAASRRRSFTRRRGGSRSARRTALWVGFSRPRTVPLRPHDQTLDGPGERSFRHRSALACRGAVRSLRTAPRSREIRSRKSERPRHAEASRGRLALPHSQSYNVLSGSSVVPCGREGVLSSSLRGRPTFGCRETFGSFSRRGVILGEDGRSIFLSRSGIELSWIEEVMSYRSSRVPHSRSCSPSCRDLGPVAHSPHSTSVVSHLLEPPNRHAERPAPAQRSGRT